jgi:transcriptional regulator with XRE-family HTH domain
MNADVPPTDSTHVDELRALLNRAGLSQRAAARLLNVDERKMREWCAGKSTPPASVVRALSPRLTWAEHTQRLIDSNEKTIAAMQDGRITGVGYGPDLAGPESLALVIARLRKQNAQHHALLRLDRAFNRQQEVMTALVAQSLPHGDGILTDEIMSEAKAAQKEVRDAQAEVDRITRELLAEKR